LIEDSLHILHNLLVFDVQYLQSTDGQNAVALGVVLGLFSPIVYRPVHLHHQAGGVAVKVDDEPINDLLTAEVKIVQLIAAQCGPQPPLGGRHVAAQFLGTFEFSRVDLLTPGDVSWFWHVGFLS
jgi:hypothetical protein